MRLGILISLFIVMILMAVLGFTPIDLNNRVNDKALHFTAFLIFSACLYFLWNLSYRRNLTLTATISLSAAVVSEFIQGLLPYRTFDRYDILANVAGSISGLSLAFLLDYCVAMRREHRRRWGGKREAEYQRALMDESNLEDDLEHDTAYPASYKEREHELEPLSRTT